MTFELFHVQGGGGSTMKALEFIDRPINMLVSAWAYQDPSTGLRRKRKLIREKANLLIMDSGFLGAAKKGKLDWANQQDLMLEYADELGADRVAMMDIPMEPHILEMVGLTFNQALDLTYRNAEAMMRAKVNAKKGFVNQGWTIDHREECHKTMTQMGVPEVADWWGIGTVCMRTPETGLFEHAHWSRQNLPGHVHCFGIAQPSWVRELMAIGVNSCDSATTSMATAFGEFIVNGRRVTLTKGDEGRLLANVRMKGLLFWFNVESLEYSVFREDGPKPSWTPNPYKQMRIDDYSKEEPA